MEKNVEEMAMKNNRQIEQLKSQMVATAQQVQQKINDRVTEGMRDREKELRAKYVTPTPIFCPNVRFSGTLPLHTIKVLVPSYETWSLRIMIVCRM